VAQGTSDTWRLIREGEVKDAQRVTDVRAGYAAQPFEVFGMEEDDVVELLSNELFALSKEGVLALTDEGYTIGEKLPPLPPLDRFWLVDVNADAPERIKALPTLDLRKAKKLVEARVKGGPFAGPEDLLRLDFMDPARLDVIRPHLAFPTG
jgi:hypothetical protein